MILKLRSDYEVIIVCEPCPSTMFRPFGLSSDCTARDRLHRDMTWIRRLCMQECKQDLKNSIFNPAKINHIKILAERSIVIKGRMFSIVRCKIQPFNRLIHSH